MMKKKKKNILIVGAGKEGAAFLDILHDDRLVNIVGIVDPKPGAIGMQRAQKLGIRTARTWQLFAKKKNLDEIIDTTGSKRVYESLLKDRPKHADIISGRIAKTMRLLLKERKIAGEALKESEERYRDLWENVEDLVQSVAPDGSFVYVNSAWHKTLGYSKKDIPKLKLFDIIHPDSRRHCEEIFKRLMKGERVGRIEAIFLTKDRKTIPVEGNVNCRLENGKPVATRAIFRVVSERKKGEEALKKAKEELEIQAWGLNKTNEAIKQLYAELSKKNKELERLDQLKSDFVSTVSHELRTPLAIIKEGINLVLDRITGPLSDKQEKVLVTAKNNIERLEILINDLLDISKIESGKIELNKGLVNVVRVINGVIASFEPKARTKGLELIAKYSSGNICVYADPDKLIQVFVNLVNNALKFTEKGHVEISVEEKEDEITCIVSDTGIGIEDENIPKVFGKFQQFNRTEGGGEKGTGLGLSITKGIVELHGGHISAESTFGKGARFIFTLPKYNVDMLFKEQVGDGIKKAMREHEHISLIGVSFDDVNMMKKNIPAEKVESLVKEFGRIINNSLRRSGDIVVKDSGEIVIILGGCDKRGTLSVGARLERTLKDYLTSERLNDKVTLKYRYVTYPDDAKTEQELITKMRGSEV